MEPTQADTPAPTPGPEGRDWNALRFDPGAGRDHVESFFLKANEPSGDRALWLRATVFVSAREPQRPLAEGWAIAFDRRGGTARHVAVKHTVPFSSAAFDAHGLGATWALAGRDGRPDQGVTLRPGEAKGRIATREHSIGWDLRWAGEARPLVPLFHPRMYSAPFPKSKLVTPYPTLDFRGSLEVDGERWQIDGWRGMQGHNWGRGNADLYAWCHCNLWDDGADFVLEGASARVRVGPVLTPLTTTVCVRHRGVAYDFITPRSLWKAHGDVGLRRWTFSSASRLARIEGEVEATTDDLVGLHYPNPDGTMTYCLNSKLARARVRFEVLGRAPVELVSRAAALEIGTLDDAHGVRMHV
jgi:hypothetical protein